MTSHSRDATWPSADFEAVYVDLVRFLARRTGSTDQARELAHDTWLKLAASPAPADVRHGPAYVFGAARHLAIDEARQGMRRGRLQDDLVHVHDAATGNLSDQLAHRQALQAIELALDALPARTREAFLAHRLDGVGHDDLAAHHGVSRSTIERDVQRAQAQVRSAIERWCGRSADRTRRRSLGALLGVGGLVGCGGAAWSAWQHLVPTWQRTLATRRGQVTRYTLPDGSTATLDADSELALVFRGRSRRSHLVRGGAFFDVVHDIRRPFTVDTATARVTVLGTRFAVELDAAGTTTVGVRDGRVRLAAAVKVRAEPDGAEALLLAAGESAQVVRGRGALRVSSPDGEVATWRDGWLRFTRQPLGVVVARLNRYRQVPIAVDPAVRDVPVSAEIRLTQIDDWVRLLPAVALVRVGRDHEGHPRIGPR